MSRLYRLASAVAAALLVGACADTPTAPEADPDLRFGRAPQATMAAVYVVHGINGRDLGLAQHLPVDVSVNGACVLPGFTFRQIVGPLALPPGAYNIKVSLASAGSPCSQGAVIAATVPLGAGDNVAIAAHLTNGGAPTASVFHNVFRAAPVIIARHAANFGPVDLWLDRGTPISRTVSGLPNGQQAWARLIPGSRTVEITPAGSSTVVFGATIHANPFETTVAYAVGTPANGTFEVLVQSLGISDRLATR